MIYFYWLSAAMLAGCACYYSPYAYRFLRVRSIRKRLAQSRTIVLTYDDGPSEFLTPRLLTILRSYGARATFFMLGSNAQRYPAIADQILREGHEIGCHSDKHLNAWKVTPSRAIADINAGYDTLSQWVPYNGRFRPPYGKITLPTFNSVRRRGASISWWTIDSGDTAQLLPSPNEVVEAVLDAKGGIVLMHDLGRSKEREDFVCETTIQLLEAARRGAFNVKKLSDLSHGFS